MPNLNAPRGLTPVKHLNGSPYNSQHVLAYIPSSDATATFVGDVVQHGGSSGAAGFTINGLDLEGIPQVTKPTGTVAAATNLFGVVVGFLPDPASLTTVHRLASTNRVALVCTDPTVVYEIQEDATGNVLAAADIGLKASFNAGTGTASTGRSTATINNASKATTSTLPLRVLNLVKRADNAFNTGGTGTDQAKYEVTLDLAMFTGMAGT
jgi:hypothetical protein